ncbi:hypothetical protein LX32DRAFT_637054 [Colletotrichum zoysiae]|uniref:Uncharacterized protein n=1 Tax=Colletotrichum zoysiae TaxID=1216348 RepID=A0AAD9HNR2_9PEZI|nr:hypothetical protein LX32DRAFT_637054 [Colletotrichum zoysiae]
MAAKGSSSARGSSAPVLPPNVTIFSPAKPSAADALLNGCIFTRLTANAQAEPSKLTAALEDASRRAADDDAFCLGHRNVVLIFDAGRDGADVADAHHEHFRLVCLALKDADISLDVAGCVFDSPSALQAGFQLDTLSSGSVLVIDLMGGDGQDSDEEGDEAAAERLLMSGDSGATMS